MSNTNSKSKKKLFLTINGKSAWISERETIDDAIQSAINICDHSEEVIVREIDTFTDYSKVYYNVTQ